MATTLADLAQPERRDALLASRASTPAGALADDGTALIKLFQPIQRRFHLALIEAWCDIPGTPRLDPTAVEAAGLVVRRQRPRAQTDPQLAGTENRERKPSSVLEGWMRSGERPMGWLPVDQLEGGEPDPLPAIRAARRATGVASLDRLLLPLLNDQAGSGLEEDVMPMFVAPPDTCKSAGRTLYYGLVSTTSQERASAPQDIETALELLEQGNGFFHHLISPLQGKAFTFPTLPAQASSFDASFKSAFEALVREQAPIDAEAAGGPRAKGESWIFHQLLMQLAVEFDAFGPSEASQRLRATLRKIHLSYREGNGAQRLFGPLATDEFLHRAVRVLLEGEEDLTVPMPRAWPLLTDPLRSELHDRLRILLRERLNALAGRRGRYDQENATYKIRAFLRLKPRDGCPGKTVWSDYSDPFVIAPWYDSAGTDSVQIPLPDLTDRNQLRSLKPNVSFVVPAKLADLLQSNGADLLEGKSSGASMGIQWICGFSIPIITLCAFIVLNIFLSLLNIFLGWLFYIKVCIPFPKR